MTLFDAYVVIDWSANSSPKSGKDSIWVANAVRAEGGGLVTRTQNPRTRAAAASIVDKLLQEHHAANRSVLIGFDFPYGYPAGFAKALRGASDLRPWLTTWGQLRKQIQDDGNNKNNRFEVAARLNSACCMLQGPFWGCPEHAATDGLSQTSPDWRRATLRQYRHTELRLRAKRLRVQEA